MQNRQRETRELAVTWFLAFMTVVTLLILAVYRIANLKKSTPRNSFSVRAKPKRIVPSLPEEPSNKPLTHSSAHHVAQQKSQVNNSTVTVQVNINLQQQTSSKKKKSAPKEKNHALSSLFTKNHRKRNLANAELALDTLPNPINDAPDAALRSSQEQHHELAPAANKNTALPSPEKIASTTSIESPKEIKTRQSTLNPLAEPFIFDQQPPMQSSSLQESISTRSIQSSEKPFSIIQNQFHTAANIWEMTIPKKERKFHALFLSPPNEKETPEAEEAAEAQENKWQSSKNNYLSC